MKSYFIRLAYIQFQIERAKGNKTTLKECLAIVLKEFKQHKGLS